MGRLVPRCNTGRMHTSEALEWAAARRTGVLITIRRDGRAQSSDVVYAVSDGQLRISLTADRAKTINMRRDPRVVFHITDPGAWSYVSFDATVELSPECVESGDATADELVDVYRSVTGEEHSDWEEFRTAMVSERRLVARLTPGSVTGQIH